jgi:GDP-mannose 6-dehydrogenase
MRISIFGIGYVGAVSSACLASLGHEVMGVDVSADKVAMLNRGQSPIVEDEIDGLIATGVREGKLSATSDVEAAIAWSDMSFISVGTPSAADGSVSMLAVDAVVAAIGRAIGRKAGGHIVVMRSTVPPGTAEDRVIPVLERLSGRKLGDRLHYYSNPEFLREGSSVRDFHAPPFTLIGAADGDDAPAMRELYAPVGGSFQLTSYKVAESVKYLSNVYHAVKLAFANEAGAVLAAHGVDARQAFRLFCEDRVLNISPAYLRPGFAFGGSCLPKDTRSFLALAEAGGVTPTLLRQLLPANQSVVDRSFAAIIAQCPDRRIALFGLAFKSGTDDLRESPFVTLAERFLGKGYDVCIFDRSVQIARLTGSNRAFIEREIPHLERLMVGTPAEALAGRTLAVIGHVAPADRPALIAALNGHVIFDLAGIDELRDIPGTTYVGLCW